MATFREEPERAWILRDNRPDGEGVSTLYEDGTLFRARMEMIDGGMRRVRMVPLRLIEGEVGFEK